MKLQIKENGKVVKEINLTPVLDALLIILCIIGIILGIKTMNGTIIGYCILGIILTFVTWHPKYRWYFKE